MPDSSTDFLQRRRDAIRTQTERMLLDARAAGRSQLNATEARRYREALEDLRNLDADLERRSQIDQSLARLSDRTNTDRKTPMNELGLTYRRDGGPSYLRDLMRVALNTDDGGESRRRLAAHSDEIRTHTGFRQALLENRDISTAQGEAGYFVPPYWAVDQWIDYARPGRPFADLITRQPLPAGTNSINVPKILTGTKTDIQFPENTAVAEQDISDTFVNAQVRTIAGQQSISQQLLDQSPLNFDQVILTDLAAAQAVNVDEQVLYGSGVNGEVLGVANWPGILTIAVADSTVGSLYKALANAVNQIWTTRFAAPTAIVMHPRRWAALLSQLDQNSRPLFLPEGNHPMNAMGIMSNVDPQALVGRALGLPIYTDASITTTAGPGSPGTQDVIYVLRTQDVVVFESGLRTRVMPEPLAQTLTVLVQCFSYLALAVRYPSSIVEITNLAAPTF
jgi:HK97 family phage major capsid protein